VPTDLLPADKLAELWDEVALTTDEQDVKNALKLVTPNFENLAFRKRRNSQGQLSYRAAIVKVAGVDSPFPLKSLGSGMSRTLQLVLSLLQAKGGFLLIDEFENGLHYAVQPQLWELIFKLGTESNIQVFATTHSWDCVRAFHSVWEEQENDGSFHRIDEYPGEGMSVMPYDGETLGDALEINGEMR
jgi:AAA15 family ATPase/GTPase